MTLADYRRKRDFAVTAEPKGKRARQKGNRFVIQKHDATRLHYDLRLELAGVLKSWAVTRGPSLVSGEKRLAVEVEDHPLDYGDFEGTIPKGQYGAGTVIVWDRGEWSPVGDPARGLAKGHLEFALEGEKLKGQWHLVRMQERDGEKRTNWLLIKAEDDFARPEDAPDILEEQPLSVKSGRDLSEVVACQEEASKPRRRRKAASQPEEAVEDAPDPSAIPVSKRARMPDFIPPMLAKLSATAPSGNRWLHEMKFDGYRLQARVEGGKVRLLTRSGLDWTAKFGKQVTKALSDLPVTSAILDGELVVEGASGASDFSALQADLSEGRSDRFVYYAFDLPYLDGHDLRSVPLTDRKTALERLVSADKGPVRYSEHFQESGAMVLRHACRLSLEGIVSKLADAPYRSGRGPAWIKSKCSARQEFVIGGYVPSSTTAKALGSLALGVYEDGALAYVGRVGTGFSASVAKDLFRQLEPIRQNSSPFRDPLTSDQSSGLHHVRPEFVAEVEFRAWTADGHLRHASFRGLREDKPAQEIVRETATPTRPPAAPKRRVKLTHPDRVYWPDAGVTKEGLADYYAEVWRHIAPHVVGRPLALLRCPEGITGQQFFQKHAWKGLNPNIRLVEDPTAPGEKLIAIEDLDGLLGLVQSATLEIHPWGSSLEDWDRPDRIVIDLDPGDGVAWQAVIDAAREVQDRLTTAGLHAFVKTSGGKGLHVVAPLKPHADWPAVKVFSQTLARVMAADSPDAYVATVTKSKRRGKILIDYLRNQRGATAVAAFSSRARPGAPVSMPIGWEELGPEIGPAHFTVLNAPGRLSALAADPWQDFRKAAVALRPQGKKRS